MTSSVHRRRGSSSGGRDKMSLFSRFFHRRPPDGLLEFVDRVYVFDSCFLTEALPDGLYNIYLHEIITELNEEFWDSSFLAFNFREGEKRSQFAELLCEFDVTVVDYPRQYEGCPILPLPLIHHFLRVCESWLSMGDQQNIILLHCERGGWPLLAFLLASFLIFRKVHSAEHRVLDMIHREAPKGFLQLLSPLNPFPSQLRYLYYVARRNISPEWPPKERALSLDCLILRAIPSFDSQSGCRPIIRIFGRNLLSKGGLSTQMLFSMPKTKKSLRHYGQVDCDVIKIDIQCLVQGDVVLECLHLDIDLDREIMMFRIMFNTAFIRSNILMLNCEDLDILWDSKERFPKGFRAEVLFGEVETISPARAPTATLNGEEKGGLPIEAFSRVQELFSGVEWVDPGGDAALWLLRQLSANALQDKLEKIILSDVKELSRLQSQVSVQTSPTDSEEETDVSKLAGILDFADFEKIHNETNVTTPTENFLDDSIAQDIALNDSGPPCGTIPQPSIVSTHTPMPNVIEHLLPPFQSNDLSLPPFHPPLHPSPVIAPTTSIGDALPPQPSPPPSPPHPPPLPSSKGTPPPPPPLPPPPPSFIVYHSGPRPPPPPPLPFSTTSTPKPPTMSPPPPPPPPPPPISTSPPPPPPPPPPPSGSGHIGKISTPRASHMAPPPPPPPTGPTRKGPIPPPPPPQAPKPPGVVPPPPPSRGNPPGPSPPPEAKIAGVPAPPPPSVGRGRTSSGPSLPGHGRARGAAVNSTAPKKASLKPLHWVKVTRAMQGSLWDDSQTQESQTRAPEIDISELESLFSAAVASSGSGMEKGGIRRGSNSHKPEIVQLIDLRRAYNCEIMLTKIKMPLPDMINAVLALDTSALDIDQVENLIKFCPTKEEMEMLKNYTGNKENLGKCEQFFLELMKVPRVESKLRVFSFTITFSTQVKDLRSNLNTINNASGEVKDSVKLRQIMQTILTLGNALNQGTARGSAIGFKLDSLLKLSDTRARNNKMTLMHYLCKVLAEQMPEVLDFDKDLVHLESASKIQLKSLAEEMQAVSKGLEKVEQELTASENDGSISMGFQKALKNFLDTAEAEVRSLISLYSEVGRSADSLSQYFGEDPARCPFEQVTSILVIFVKMFSKSKEENDKQADAEKKKLEKEAMKERCTSSVPESRDLLVCIIQWSDCVQRPINIL
ncbi:Tensin phosphatase [Macleaya cordata]|uniref:Formin-like protein n=1 Tax=Macleaya cordata TaxID=56857 RepID=A0A200QIS4_MACCD|nr:Tensin phosphatase [Macleaya cordata]